MERIALIQEDIRQIEAEINHLQNVRQDKLAEMEEFIRQIRTEEAPRYTPGDHRPSSTWRSSSLAVGQRRAGSNAPFDGARSGGAPPAGERDPIKIVLRNDKGDRVHGQLRPDVRLQNVRANSFLPNVLLFAFSHSHPPQVMNLYCAKRNLQQGSVDFYLNGRLLDANMTADQMGAENGATIDVVPRYARPPSTSRY